MYADKITKSMEKTIEETARRRSMQIAYNLENGIVPTALNKSKDKILESTKVADSDGTLKEYDIDFSEKPSIAADPIVQYMPKDQLKKLLERTKKQMEKAAKELDFIEAARLRDEMKDLEKML